MSVPKSRRRLANVSFIQDIRDARLNILRLVSKFPKGWYRSVQSNLETLIGSAYMDVVAGNSVFLGKSTMQHDFDLRHRYFARAAASLNSVNAELSFCLDCVHKGNNFFKSKDEYMKTFATCTRLCTDGLKKLKKVMTSDKKRWAFIIEERGQRAEMEAAKQAQAAAQQPQASASAS